MNTVHDEQGTTRDASKDRREKIKDQMAIMRDLLPLPETARQRLAQLQIMSLSCVYIRKCNYFPRIFPYNPGHYSSLPYDFTEALNGFLIVMTRDGKLVYLSDNITQYLGHSKVDMMTQGDEINDIIDSRDHAVVSEKLQQPLASEGGCDERSFICSMNVSRKLRRQPGLVDQKLMHIRGRFLLPKYPGHYGNQAVFFGICSPVVTPELKDTMIPNSTLIFRSVHTLSMHCVEISNIGEFHLGYTSEELRHKSWYDLIHPDDTEKARDKHIQLIKANHELGCMLTVRLLTKSGEMPWCNIVMHVVQNSYQNEDDEPNIICTNQLISADEAPLFRRLSQSHNAQRAQSPECLSPSDINSAHPIDCEAVQQYNPYMYAETADLYRQPGYSHAEATRHQSYTIYDNATGYDMSILDDGQYGGYNSYQHSNTYDYMMSGNQQYPRLNHDYHTANYAIGYAKELPQSIGKMNTQDNAHFDDGAEDLTVERIGHVRGVHDYVIGRMGHGAQDYTLSGHDIVTIGRLNRAQGAPFVPPSAYTTMKYPADPSNYYSVPMTPPSTPSTSPVSSFGTSLTDSINTSAPLSFRSDVTNIICPLRNESNKSSQNHRKRGYDLKVINVLEIDDYFAHVSPDSSENEQDGGHQQSRKRQRLNKLDVPSLNSPSHQHIASANRVLNLRQPPPSHGASKYLQHGETSAGENGQDREVQCCNEGGPS